SIAETSINHTRAGLRPASPDDLLMLGPVPTVEGVLLATGHGRSGILLAPVTARMLADLITKGPDAVDLGPHSASRLERRTA
ncbi:MAG: FAD-dependent oxidoreductase, partial [Dehalococcoidia bacterium]